TTQRDRQSSAEESRLNQERRRRRPLTTSRFVASRQALSRTSFHGRLGFPFAYSFKHPARLGTGSRRTPFSSAMIWMIPSLSRSRITLGRVIWPLLEIFTVFTISFIALLYRASFTVAIE